MESFLAFAESNPWLAAMAMFWLPWPTAFAVCWIADVIAGFVLRLLRL